MRLQKCLQHFNVLKTILLILWLVLLITMPTSSWLIVNNKINVTYRLLTASLSLPYLIMLLSLYVFNRIPSPFRMIHHSFILLLFFISLAFVYKFTFHGGEQGGVGAYLLIYSVGAAYLCFISLFLFALVIKLKV